MIPTGSSNIDINYCQMESIRFSEWLQNELKKRNWSKADLARNSHLSSGTIARIMNETRNPGPDVLKSISRALNIPTNIVFEIAGLLPKNLGTPPIAEEAKYIVSQLSEEDQETAIYILRAIREKSEKQYDNWING